MCIRDSWGTVFNAAPIATADAYETYQSVPLEVTEDEGVLANDSDPDADPLTAVLVTAPIAGQGTLTFNSDGSFKFTPASGFSKPATFTYQAYDGIDTSTVVTVTIQVKPNKQYLPMIVTQPAL